MTGHKCPKCGRIYIIYVGPAVCKNCGVELVEIEVKNLETSV
jgi:uncharacterized OB-fold protein